MTENKTVIQRTKTLHTETLLLSFIIDKSQRTSLLVYILQLLALALSQILFSNCVIITEYLNSRSNRSSREAYNRFYNQFRQENRNLSLRQLAKKVLTKTVTTVTKGIYPNPIQRRVNFWFGIFLKSGNERRGINGPGTSGQSGEHRILEFSGTRCSGPRSRRPRYNKPKSRGPRSLRKWGRRSCEPGSMLWRTRTTTIDRFAKY